jgi:hypothetical protein
LAISIPVSAKLLVDAHIPTLKMHGSGTRRPKVILIIFADGKKQSITEFATFRPKRAGARWPERKVQALIEKFWEFINAHYNESWLINPFTNKNGAVVNLGEFLRGSMHYHADEQTWNNVDGKFFEPVVQMGNVLGATTVVRKATQYTRTMLAQKRRRVESVPEAALVQQVQGTQPLLAKKRRTERDAVIEPAAKSSVPSGFLAWQKQKRQKN